MQGSIEAADKQAALVKFTPGQQPGQTTRISTSDTLQCHALMSPVGILVRKTQPRARQQPRQSCERA